MAVAHVARAVGTAVVSSALALPVHAVLPNKIQVYTGDINAPGESGLELHVNTTPSDIGIPSYPGEVTTPHGWRTTTEFSYGLAPSLKLRFYIPITLTRENTFYMTGPKVRVKWMPVRPVGGVGNFAGTNVELAHVAGHFEASQNAAELRPIYEYQDDRWLWAINPVLDRDFSGDGRSGVPEAAPSFRIAQTVVTGVHVGTEYYAGLGPANRIAPSYEQQHIVFLAFDVDRKPFVFNFGIGRGLTRASDRWMLKQIFEVPLSRSPAAEPRNAYVCQQLIAPGPPGKSP